MTSCPFSPALAPSGLGYIAGSKVKDVAGDWHWALRVSLVTAWGEVSNMFTDSPLFTFRHPVFRQRLLCQACRRPGCPPHKAMCSSELLVVGGRAHCKCKHPNGMASALRKESRGEPQVQGLPAPTGRHVTALPALLSSVLPLFASKWTLHLETLAPESLSNSPGWCLVR